MQGYFRDDRPLCELVLDEPSSASSTRSGGSSNFVTGVPMRQYKDFIFFERAEPPRYMREAAFDFARSEDKDAISERRSSSLRELTWPRHGRSGRTARPIEAIETYFAEIAAEIRQVEQARLAAEPSHLEALAAFAERAYRRPLSSAERDDLIAFYRTLREKDGLAHEDAIRDTVASMLLSPHFCLPRRPAEPGAAAQPLSDYALASRLSYFLWSSMPDEELLAHAAAGDLHEPDVLVAQAQTHAARRPGSRARDRVRRQLAGVPPVRGAQRRRPRAVSELHERAAPGDVRGADPLLRRRRQPRSLRCSTCLYGDVHLRQPGSGQALRHAGPEGRARTNGFVSMTPTASAAGGCLPMSVFLTASSPGLRTSPVKRGYWVVRKLLGEQIPPPPPVVPELPKDEAKSGELTLPQLLARHRDDKNCASCHQRFDSIGLVFEGYGPIGERRDRDLGNRPVETKATFPDGSEGTGLDGLRTIPRRAPRRTSSSKTSAASCWFMPWARSLISSDEPIDQGDARPARGRGPPVRQPDRDDRDQPAVPQQRGRDDRQQVNAMGLQTCINNVKSLGIGSTSRNGPVMQPNEFEPPHRPSRRGRHDGPSLARIRAGVGQRGPRDGRPAFPKRFAALFMGNGISPKHWWAKGAGKDMELSKTLEPHAAVSSRSST